MIEILKGKTMQINYFKSTNSISIKFDEKPSFETKEISEDVILDFDEQGKILAIEILSLPKLESLNQLNAIGFKEILQVEEV